MKVQTPEEKLFILDLLKLNKSIKIDDKVFYPEESVINIIKQVLNKPAGPAKELTDEEIEKEAYNYCAYQGQPDGEPEFDEKSYNDFKEAAKWARSRMQGDLREELIKAFDWLSDKESPYAILYGNLKTRFATGTKDYTTEQVIDKYIEYLNSKK